LTTAQHRARDIVRRLRRRRIELGLLQREVAEKVGVTAHALCRWESKAAEHLWLDTILELADALDCDVDIAIKPRTAKSTMNEINTCPALTLPASSQE
jgi:transcriptional regulator with XRE-family HTH domain